MPYLTPDEIPEDGFCRPLLIPFSSEWLAIVSGALTELTKEWNWQQEGAVTVPEAIAAIETMLEAYYDSSGVCCALPDGEPIARLNEFGEWQVLDNGAWQQPSGELTLPPPDPRAEATDEEKRCLAARNAAAVLEQLYEEVADLAGAVSDLAEFVTGVGVALGILFATPLGILGAAALALGIAIVETIYDTAQFILADVWTAGFTEELTCILYDNATVQPDDTVTFDFDQVRNDIVNLLAFRIDFTLAEQRLSLQVGALLGFIGFEGLNIAGGTTSVSSYSCAGCDEVCGYVVDFSDPTKYEIITPYLGGSFALSTVDNAFGNPLPSLAAGAGTDGSGLPGKVAAIEIVFTTLRDISSYSFDFYYNRTDGVNAMYCRMDFYGDGGAFIGFSDFGSNTSQNTWNNVAWSQFRDNVRMVRVYCGGSGGGYSGNAWIDNICLD